MENPKVETRELGKSGVFVPTMSVGAMLWSPQPGMPITESEVMDVYKLCIDKGFNFFDTAEIYGNGKSEEILGRCIKADGRPVMIATKFAPPSKMIPIKMKRTTVSPDSPLALKEAIDKSLSRLGIDCIDLYQMHAPPVKNTITDYMNVMADAVKASKIRAVGVCNFSEKQLREAHGALAKRGAPLATAMVGYNVLRRWPETNGVFKTCKELGISVIPYAPLAEGILTGKYRGGKKIPIGYKATLYFGHLDVTKERTDSVPFVKKIFTKPRELNKKKMEPVFAVMEDIAKTRGKTMAQVAINWLITNEDVCVIPIPGMRNAKQVNDNIGTVGWKLSSEERARIDEAEKASRE